MKRTYAAMVVAGCLWAVVLPAVAAGPQEKVAAAEQGDPALFTAYVERLKQQALAQGISQRTVDIAFADVHFVGRVVSQDKNQPEKKLTLDDYLTWVLSAKKLERGRVLLEQHRAKLNALSMKYGVPPQYIVTLWGLESYYGRMPGKEDVISALATLAFEGRREAFFTGQLMAALKILQDGHIGREQMKGSWAGAMGQNQFMPTSFLKYGADGDEDGRIDIWNNVNDVFASTANYLASEGWRNGERWGQEVRLPAGFDERLAGLRDDQSANAETWLRRGVTLADAQAVPPGQARAWIILPDDAQGRAFMVYDNFRVLMHWNRSYYFAISVGMMADGLAR